jgi:hypothetical protein
MLKSLLSLFSAASIALAASGASAEPPADVKVIAEATSEVNISAPASNIPVVKTKPGWVSTIRITEGNGSPAEILDISVGNGNFFELAKGADNASVNVYSNVSDKRTNLNVRLEGYNKLLTVILESTADTVHAVYTIRATDDPTN